MATPAPTNPPTHKPPPPPDYPEPTGAQPYFPNLMNYDETSKNENHFKHWALQFQKLETLPYLEKKPEVILQRSHGLTPSNTVSSLLNTIFASCYIIKCPSERVNTYTKFNIEPEYSSKNVLFDPVAREDGKRKFISWLKSRLKRANKRNKMFNLEFIYLPDVEESENYRNWDQYNKRDNPVWPPNPDALQINLMSVTNFLQHHAQVVAELCILLMLPIVYNFTAPYTLVPAPDPPVAAMAPTTPTNVSFCNMFFDETIMLEPHPRYGHDSVLYPVISYNTEILMVGSTLLEPRGIMVVTQDEFDWETDFENPKPANALSFAPPAPRTLRDIRDRLAHIKRRTGDARAGAFVFGIVDKLNLSNFMDPEMFRTLIQSRIDTFLSMS